MSFKYVHLQGRINPTGFTGSGGCDLTRTSTLRAPNCYSFYLLYLYVVLDSSACHKSTVSRCWRLPGLGGVSTVSRCWKLPGLGGVSPGRSRCPHCRCGRSGSWSSDGPSWRCCEDGAGDEAPLCWRTHIHQGSHEVTHLDLGDMGFRIVLCTWETWGLG